MRYESEILYDLMKRDGLLNPSQNHLPYESELKEKYVNDVVGAYPKLNDYRSEWLNYALEDGVGEFPYVTLTDVTNATINNVVPYAYKSAILKGNSIKNYKNNLFDNVLEKGAISITTGTPNESNLRCYRSVNFIPINGNFKIAKYGIGGDLHVCFYDSNKSFISNKTYVLRKVTEGTATVTPPTNSSFIKFYNPYDDNEPTGEFGFGVMAENEIIELEIQSVKMPVLTTVGKNLFDKDNVNHISGFISSNKTIVSINNVKTYYIKCKSNTNYTISKIKSNYFRVGSTNSEPIEGGSITTFVANDTTTSLTITTGLSDNYLCFNINNDSIASDITEEEILNSLQIEEGSQATPHEPYKTNILTVNEDVTLRGIGEVKDELNLLTGEVTERISKIILDGTQSSVTYSSQYSNDDYYSFIFNMTNDGFEKAPSSPIGISCPITFQQNKMFSWTAAKEYVLIGSDGNTLLIKLLKSKLNNDNSISSLNTYLASNPITIQYPLETESIKTVELTVTDQNGNNLSQIKPIEGTMNLTTSSDTIAPTFTGEIPVEAIEQNLASFANLEGVEHDG